MNVGIDIAEVKRFCNCKSSTLNKIFSAAEIAYINEKGNSAETVAGLYCAKEAYFKAKGTGIIKSKLSSVEISHAKNGQPFYKNDPNAVLSISHTKTAAVAVCIVL
jgi:holo-[acyl-carrier protein] synthase